jgi:hypothetical protein
MNCRAYYKLSRLSCVMSFGFLDLQLWLKNQTAIHSYVLLDWVRIVISLSNVVLANCLDLRLLTEEEQLYIRLSRLGKYFSMGQEICTCCKVIWIEH